MADTMLVAPGQAATPDDWSALERAHKGVKSSTPLPLNDPKVVAAISAGVDVTQHPIYRYYFGDGTVLEGYNAENGQDIQVVDYKPSSAYTQSQSPAGARAEEATKPTTPRIEGTPDPSKPGGFDNEQPIMVQRDAQGNQVGPARPLTAAERTDWEESRQQSRNPGGKTDKQVKDEEAAAATKQPSKGRVPVKDHPGIYLVKTDTPATATTPATSDTHYEDEAGNTVPEPKDAPKPGLSKVKGGDGKDYTVVTTVDSAGKVSIQNYGPDGQPVATIPGDVPKPAIAKGAGPNGEDVQAVPDPEHPGQVKYVPIPGAAGSVMPPASAAGWTPDPQKPAYGLVERYQELIKQVEAGTLTREQAKAAYTQDQENAKTYAQQIGQTVNTASAGYTGEINQRNQDVSLANNRVAAAASGFKSAVDTGMKLNGDLPQGSDLGGKAIIGLMALNAANAQGMGGLKEIPHVPVPPAMQQMATLMMPNGVKLDIPMAPGLSTTGGTTPAPSALPLPAMPGLPSPLLRPQPPVPAGAVPSTPQRDDWSRQGMAQPSIFDGLDQQLSGIFGNDVVAEANRQIQQGLGLGA